MCITSKGPAYNPAEKVAEAIELAKALGRSMEEFFKCAQKHTMAPFDVQAVVRLYEANAGQPDYTPLQAVVTFADWMSVKDEHAVAKRFRELLDGPPVARRTRKTFA